MSAPDPRRDQIATVLIEHTRTSIENCHCGWGADFTKLGQSHPYHVAEQLQPIIDAAVGQARAETAEQIAQALDDINSAYAGDPEVQRGLRIAALVVRKREESRP